MKPGQDLIDKGIADLKNGDETVESLLVSIGAPRLRSLGIPISLKTFSTPEHRLYNLLSKDGSDAAHSKYNALIRLLVSFERSAKCEN